MALLPDLVPLVHDGSIELRRWRPSHAGALTDAVAASLAELRPWMPWAQEPPTVSGIRLVLTEGDANFEAGKEWQFVVAETGSDRILGATGLHRRNPPESVEIGYWIRTDATGCGLATAAARALTAAAFASLLEVTIVEIRMDSLNLPSAAIPPKLGFRFDRHVDQAVEAPGQSGRRLVWVMDRARWAAIGG